MAVITLNIEFPGGRPPVRIEVQATDFVGTCVASLVEKFGYPIQDIGGKPVVYQLRPITSMQPLANTARFRDAQVRSGTRFTLEAKEANYATIPLGEQSKSAESHPSRYVDVHSRRSRRYFLWTCACGAALAGTGLGMSAAAFGQRYMRRNVGNTGIRPIASQLPSPVLLRGATLQSSFTGHQLTVRAVDWSPGGGTMIASGGDDGLLIWDAATGTLQQRIAPVAPVRTLTWSPEGQRIVSGAANQVAFYGAFSGTLLARSTGQHTGTITSVAWTGAHLKHVVSAGEDKRAIIWETETYQSQTIFAQHDTPIESVSWAADGQVVASSSQGGAVRVWNAENALQTHGFYNDAAVPMGTCAFAPIGTALAVGGNDGVVRVWNSGLVCQAQQTENAGLVCQDIPLRLPSDGSSLRSLAWSPDGRSLLGGYENGSLHVWLRVQNTLSLAFTLMISPPDVVHSLSWSPDGTRIATAVGSRVLIWQLLSETVLTR
ncbi:MAG: hypothetical protein NVS4B11_32500 [Ktedonobacteraceae bacterium]